LDEQDISEAIVPDYEHKFEPADVVLQHPALQANVLRDVRQRGETNLAANVVVGVTRFDDYYAGEIGQIDPRCPDRLGETFGH
jgi:hypothetical protein